MTDQPASNPQERPAGPVEGSPPGEPTPAAPAQPAQPASQQAAGAAAPADAPQPQAPAPAEQPTQAAQAVEPAGQGAPQSAGEVPAPPASSESAGPSSLLPGIGPKEYVWGTGRRKTAVARVRIRPGSGKFLINKREVEDYFKSDRDRQVARSPLETAGLVTTFDVWANVSGGGPTGQADAVKLGLARALAKAVPEITVTLREKGLLTRDARIKERKKYGRRGARRGMQWAKR